MATIKKLTGLYSGFASINEVNYQISKLAIELNDPAQTITARFNNELKLDNIKYDQLINGDTLSAFASYADLKTYVNKVITPEVNGQILSAVSLTNTGSTTENTMFTGTIPANSIGVTGMFEAIVNLINTSSANSKIYRLKFNGVVVGISTITSSTGTKHYYSIHNDGSLSSQFIQPLGGNSSVTFSSTASVIPANLSIDTSQDITVTITCQLALGTETMTVKTFSLRAIP